MLKCKFCGKDCKNNRSKAQHEIRCKQNPDCINFSAPVQCWCHFCGKECKSKNSLTQHEIRCKNNPNKIEIVTTNFTSYTDKIKKGLIKGTNQFIKAKQEGRTIVVSQETRKKLSKVSKGRKYTPEEIKRRCLIMRKFWKEHPELYTVGPHKDYACQKLKRFLDTHAIIYTEEYMPLEDRAFRIDIAFPDIKLGIEANGSHHYLSSGTLKHEYQERHDLIVASGWTLCEIPNPLIYKQEFLDVLLDAIRSQKANHVLMVVESELAA